MWFQSIVTQRTPGSLEHPKTTFMALFLSVALSAWDVCTALGETPSSAWLWLPSHCDKPSFCTEQSCPEYQESLWKGWDPNASINILKYIRMSTPHLGLYGKYKERVKCAVLPSRGKDQRQQQPLRLIRPNRGMCLWQLIISQNVSPSPCISQHPFTSQVTFPWDQFPFEK